jgi:Mn2+/Fe2+ NRAMP family transporter
LLGVVGLLLAANTLNISADIAAMAEVLRLLLGGSAHVYAITFGLTCLVMQVFLPYASVVRWLKWLTLALLAYVAVAFSLQLDWWLVLQRTFLPELVWSRELLLTVVAVLGTTISPYLFFWQAAQEVEERHLHHRSSDGEPRSLAQVHRHLRRIQWDTNVGMLFSNLVAFFIILSTAATLHASGITSI